MLSYHARRPVLVGIVVGLALIAGACGSPQQAAGGERVRPTAAPAPTTSLSPSPSPTSPPPVPGAPGAPGVLPPLPIDPAILTAQATAVEPDTTLGVVVYDTMTQTEPLAWNADRQFRSASLVKLMMAIDTLTRGATDLDRKRISEMLATSSDRIANSFWVQGGRPDIVTRSAAMLGLTGTAPPENPGRWGEVLLTPHDMVRVYDYVLTGLPDIDRTLIVDALAQAPRIAEDGFDQHFGIPDGVPAPWAVKQGWGNNSSAMVLHSTGLVGQGWRYVVILLSEHPLGSGWGTSARSVTAAAAALHGQLPGV